jgi:TetR/AcrR family transcriptional regulator, transcriptional repressor for nem operon
MKSSREQAAKNRELVVNAAGRLFRERGFEGISVSEIMKSANLTHGGFYGHFKSKAELAALSCEQGIARMAGLWGRLAAERKNPLREIADHYLSERHRDGPGSGCFFAALASDVARQDPPVKRAFTTGLRASFDELASAIGGGGSKTAKRRRALAAISELVGAMVLARAVDDDRLSKEILEAARLDLGSRRADAST